MEIDRLIGRTIVDFRPMTKQELIDDGWKEAEETIPLVMVLDNGDIIYASKDEDGFAPGNIGVLFANMGGEGVVLVGKKIDA